MKDSNIEIRATLERWLEDRFETEKQLQKEVTDLQGLIGNPISVKDEQINALKRENMQLKKVLRTQAKKFQDQDVVEKASIQRLVENLREKVGQLREAVILSVGFGHRMWCVNADDQQRLRIECSCGLRELQDVLIETEEK